MVNSIGYGTTALNPSSGFEAGFLKRWLTHVLPKGFVRVRHHGWMSGAACKTRLLVRALVCGQLDEPKPVLPEPPVPRCPHRGAEMKLLATISPRGPPGTTP